MLFYIQLALKNLGRHGKRTLITASAIAVGLAAFLFIDSMLQGADLQSEQNLIRYETGALRVYTPEGTTQRKRLSLKTPFEDGESVLAALQGAGLAATGRISFAGEISARDPLSGESLDQVVRVFAVDADTDQRVFPRNSLPIEGQWMARGSHDTVVGRWLADDLRLQPGSELTLNSRTRSGSYQVIDLTVSGIIDCPNPTINRGTILIDLDTAALELEMGGALTEVAIGMPAGSDIAPVKATARAALEQAGIAATLLDWKELAADFLAITAAKQKGSSTIILLILIIAAVGISNTLLMAFYERKTEIGMLRAIGMDDRTLFWTFVLEAMGIGLIGSAIGLAVGAVAVWWLVNWGMDFGFLIRDIDIGYRISGVFTGIWSAKSFVQALVLGLVLPGLTAILPTRRALKLPITESLRRE